MTTEITVPELSNLSSATVGEWRVKVGDSVKVGDVIVELETDKVDVVGAIAGVITTIAQPTGSDGRLASAGGPSQRHSRSTDQDWLLRSSPRRKRRDATTNAGETTCKGKVTPVARRMAEAEGVDLAQVDGSGAGGRVTRQDIAARVEPHTSPEPAAVEREPAPATPPRPAPTPQTDEREERQRMSRRRRTIAQRLVEAQQTAAILTTFNEIDMSAVMDLRRRRQEAFVNQHGVKLGFTSFS
jgi:2-oxoglutarate dehydrogenase E2 component (dihydrolipoamide succinyltransferase)